MSEAEIRTQIVQYLQAIPGCLITVHAKPRGKFVSKSWPPPGWSDISGSLNGRGLYIEVKTPTGTVKQAQIHFIEKARKLGNIAFFATSIDDVASALLELNNKV